MAYEIPRLSGAEFMIMNLLISAKGKAEMYGLELVNESEGKLKRGTIYVTLGRLEDKGYVTSRREEAREGVSIPKRLYKPTGLGVKVFNALNGLGGRAWLKGAMA